MRRSVTALVVGVVGLAGCGGQPAERLSEKQLRKLVLQETDVPGFNQFAFGRETTIEFNPVLQRERDKFGHQNGWVARYRRATLTGRGPLTIASVTDVFSGNDGAREFFDALREHERKTAGMSGLKVVGSDVGDDAVAVATAKPRRGSIRFARVTWRVGRFVASVSASGFAERMSVGDVVALARKQTRRMRPS